MKATMDVARLAEAAKAVRGLVRGAPGAFGQVRLDATGCLSVTGSDGDVQVEWRIADAEVGSPGAATVPGAAFAAFVGALPDGRATVDGKAGARIWLSGPATQFRLAAGDAAGFPVMAGPADGDGARLAIGADDLRDMLRKVRFAAAGDGASRPVLAGVNVALEDGILGMTATDGRALAHVDHDAADAGAGASFDVTLPPKAVAALDGLLAGMAGRECGDVDCHFAAGAVRFVGDTWALTAKVLADAYPNWRRVIPARPPHHAYISREEFLDALGRAALAATDELGVKVTLERGCATFEAGGELSDAKIAMHGCEIADGAKCAFRANPRLLRETLEAIGDEYFTLGFDGVDGTPLVFRCASPWVAVVMPYRKKEG